MSRCFLALTRSSRLRLVALSESSIPSFAFFASTKGAASDSFFGGTAAALVWKGGAVIGREKSAGDSWT